MERQIQNTSNYLYLLEVIRYILHQTLLTGVGFKLRSTYDLLQTKVKFTSYISSVLKIVILILMTKCIYYKIWEKNRTWKSLGDFVYTASSYKKGSINPLNAELNPVCKSQLTEFFCGVFKFCAWHLKYLNISRNKRDKFVKQKAFCGEGNRQCSVCLEML